MTDYSQMDHQTLFNYVHTGNPDAMNSTAQAWQNHSQALEQATSELQSNLTAIQSQWQGAAADAYFQQSQAVATKMQTHADNAANTSTAVANTAGALSWARTNMPDPPSWLEQQTANIDSNFITGAIGFLSTGGAATAASEMAKQDIANKHQQAISTMTQLASAYTSAKSQLPSPQSAIDDPNNGNGKGNGNGNGGNPIVAPIPVYPIGGGTGGGGGGYSGGHYPGGAGSGGHLGGAGVSSGVGVGSGFGSGAGGGSAGGSPGVKVPSFTNPGGDTFMQGAGVAGGPTAGGIGGLPNPSGTSGGGGGSFGSGSGQLGGGIGAGGGAGVGALGTGALGASELGSGGAGGYGSAGAYGAGKFGTGKGGTNLGAGEGSGIWGGEGRGGASGRYGSASAAAGEGELAAGGGAGAQGQPGMMGGMGGHGGAGGSGDDRGNRAGYLRQDPDYWYGDKQAAPPGGVIE